MLPRAKAKGQKSFQKTMQEPLSLDFTTKSLPVAFYFQMIYEKCNSKTILMQNGFEIQAQLQHNMHFP